MEDAPRQIGNVVLGWLAAPDGLGFAVEWARIGKYWMDAANTTRYPGHDLLSVRANLPVTSSVTLFGRLSNITDERYAESAAYTTARGEEYAPGMPRTFYLGVQVR
jgi:outer membrane receptor protein involved in Fe transport